MKAKGFTIVELLVVITVLSILLTLVVFYIADWRKNTAETEVKNELSQAASELDTYSNFNSSYPANQSAFEAIRTSSETVNVTYIYQVDGYCLSAQSTAYPEVVWHINSKSQKTPQAGTC